MLPLFVAVVLFGSSALVLVDKFDTLPRVPNTTESRTWRLVDHGRIVYGTFWETASVYGLLIAGCVAGGIGMSNETRRRTELAQSNEQGSEQHR